MSAVGSSAPSRPSRAVRLQDVASRHVTNPRLHAAIYRRSGGRVGARLPMVGPDVALLTTTGRRSGRPRDTPLVCFRDGDRLVVAATNHGSGVAPGWLHNLRHDPLARIRLGRHEAAVVATEATGAERDRLWARMEREHPLFALYAGRAPTPIPVVVLTPDRELPTSAGGVSTGALRAAIALSGAGHVLHNAAEFDAVDALVASAVPLAVTLALWLMAARPTRGYLVGLAAWAALVVVVGGGSVLPLPIWPFEPAQTVGHYLVHAAYAATQVPALVLAVRSLLRVRGATLMKELVLHSKGADVEAAYHHHRHG